MLSRLSRLRVPPSHFPRPSIITRPSRWSTSPASPSPPPPSRPPLPQSPSPSAASSPLTPALIGLSGGVFGALAGIGGAVFMVPGLVRFCALPQPAAAGTAMTAVVSVSAASAARHGSAEASGVEWPVAALLATSAAVTTPFGARLASRVNPKLLRKALGFFLVGLAPVMPVRAAVLSRLAPDASTGADRASDAESLKVVVDANAEAVAEQAEPRNDARVPAVVEGALVAGGAGIGFAAGVLGVGGGSLMTPLIALLRPDLPMPEILGTSFAAMLPPSIVAAVTYHRLGLVRWRMVAPLVAGAAVGAGVGSEVVLALPEQVLRWGFAVVFLGMGLRILRRPIKPRPKVGGDGDKQRRTR